MGSETPVADSPADSLDRADDGHTRKVAGFGRGPDVWFLEV